jgi:hypothetical protein
MITSPQARVTAMLMFGRTAAPPEAIPVTRGVALLPTRANAAVAVKPSGHHAGFLELLSDLNPLQYIPVIGTLFRAITGEVVPEPVRDVGSLVVSTLIGGPVGAALDLGELAVEKVTGIDPEKIGDRLLADIGIGRKAAMPAAAEQVAKTMPAATHVAAATGWSPAQLAAYGVTTTAGGELEKNGLGGSDVLNGLELDQIRAREAIVRYAATAAHLST